MYEKWKNLLLTASLLCVMSVKTSSGEPLPMRINSNKAEESDLLYNDLTDLDSAIRHKLDTLYSYEVEALNALNKKGNSFSKFAYKMKFKESSFDYQVVNSLGYYGAYQFGKSALDMLGIKKDKAFLTDKHLQDAAFIAYCKHNKWILNKYIKAYKGKRINGVKITESGLLAAAHLKGAGCVIKWLNLNGKISKKAKCDANGTNLEYYMKIFNGYNTSTLVPSRRICFQLHS
jgi:hypothetical protein